MKDAFGGVFTIRLMMIFFVIYVTFIGVALNIAKAYRIKNGVINILEQGQYTGGDLSSGSNAAIGTKLESYLLSIPYIVVDEDNKIKNKYCSATDDSVFFKGVCIVPGNENSGANYYKVIVFMHAEFPFLHIDLTIPISGETMTIRDYSK